MQQRPTAHDTGLLGNCSSGASGLGRTAPEVLGNALTRSCSAGWKA
ncbi:MAG: hypothetical protein VB140_04985 [Burkholderia sp.]